MSKTRTNQKTAHSTYEENSERVWQAFHHELIILKVVIANVQHFIRIDVRRNKDCENKANYDVRSGKMQQTCSQTDGNTHDLPEPKDEVECFHLNGSSCSS